VNIYPPSTKTLFVRFWRADKRPESPVEEETRSEMVIEEPVPGSAAPVLKEVAVS